MSTELKTWKGGPWPKGVSGNPGGCPRGVPYVSTALKKLLRTPINEEYLAVNRADSIALRLYKSSMQGDTMATKEILDRVEGKPAQSLQLSTEQLPTHIIVERLVEAFLEVGIEEEMTRKVLLQLSAADDD